MTPYIACVFAQEIYDTKSVAFDEICKVGDWVIGFTIRPDKRLHIAIKGSNDLSDFVHDADFFPHFANAEMGYVHSGFYDGMQAVVDAIIKHYPQHEYSITISGHSLGGSRAALLGAELVRANYIVEEIYMFEPARPGFGTLAKYLQQHVKTLIVTKNGDDEVPDMPADLFAPWQHVYAVTDLDGYTHNLVPFADHMLDVVKPAVLRRWPEPVAA